MRVLDHIYCMAMTDILEGGRGSNRPGDRGGLTGPRGVTQSAYDDFCLRRQLPKKSVMELTDEQRRTFYFLDYWEPCGAQDMPNEIRLMHYHFAVNHGVGGAKHLLLQVAGRIPDDTTSPDLAHQLTLDYAKAQLALYFLIEQGDPTGLDVVENYRGWANRVLTAMQMTYA